MAGQEQCHLQVVIASGPEDVARAALGFAFAVSAAASGIRVVVVLTLNGIDWVTNDKPAPKESANAFDSISNYMSILRSAGAVVCLCPACIEENCLVTDENDSTRASYVGLTEVAIRAASSSVQTVVF